MTTKPKRKTTQGEREERRARKAFAEAMQKEVKLAIEGVAAGKPMTPLPMMPVLALARPHADRFVRKTDWSGHDCLCDGEGCGCLCHKAEK